MVAATSAWRADCSSTHSRTTFCSARIWRTSWSMPTASSFTISLLTPPPAPPPAPLPLAPSAPPPSAIRSDMSTSTCCMPRSVAASCWLPAAPSTASDWPPGVSSVIPDSHSSSSL